MHHELLDLLHGEELLDHGPGVVVGVELEPGAGPPVPGVLGREDGGDQQQERDHRDHDDGGDRVTLSGVCRFPSCSARPSVAGQCPPASCLISMYYFLDSGETY